MAWYNIFKLTKAVDEPVQQKQKSTEHAAAFPVEKVVRVFIPTVNFDGYDNKNQLLGSYIQGRRYFLREGNVVLQSLCNQWYRERKIRWEDE